MGATFDGELTSGYAYFSDRREAGVLLAKRLKEMDLKNVLVLAVPRGGIIIGYEVAMRLKAELDIIAPRKLHDPYNEELAIGAVMHDGTLFLNEDVISIHSVQNSYIEKEKKAQMAESARRLAAYRGKRPYPKIKGRTVVLVDDGVATGASMAVSSRWLRKEGAGRLIIASPVIHPDVLVRLKAESDEVVCLHSPSFFYAIGQFYERFDQVEDSEVVKLLNSYWQEKPH